MKIKMVLAQLILIGTVSAGVLERLNDRLSAVARPLDNKLAMRVLQADAVFGGICFGLTKGKKILLGSSLLEFNKAVVCEVGVQNSEKSTNNFVKTFNNTFYLRLMQAGMVASVFDNVLYGKKHFKTMGSVSKIAHNLHIVTALATCLVCQNNINKLKEKKEQNKNNK